MPDCSFVDIGILRALGREIAGIADAEIDAAITLRLGEAADLVDRAVLLLGRPLLRRHVQRIGGQRAIAARLARLGAFAVLLIVGDGIEARFRGRGHTGIGDYEVVRLEMLEQRDQPLLQHRQPMVHTSEPPPLAHRLIERITGSGGPEALTVAAAEALDRFLVEQALRRRAAGRNAPRVPPSAGRRDRTRAPIRSRRRRNRA